MVVSLFAETDRLQHKKNIIRVNLTDYTQLSYEKLTVALYETEESDQEIKIALHKREYSRHGILLLTFNLSPEHLGHAETYLHLSQKVCTKMVRQCKILIHFFFRLFCISSVQEYCFPRILVKTNPFTNKRSHRMADKQGWEEGRS